MERAKFITFEGGDGSGKSTLIAKVVQHFKSHNQPFITTREPGGTPIAEKIRNLILGPDALTPLAELLLYEAARAEHVEDTIRPALNKNIHVLCDRFTNSTVAYQGYGRGLGVKLVTDLNELATQGLEPDCVVWLKLPADQARRRSSRRGEQNRIDKEKAAFHESVYGAFLKMASERPEHFIVLNASLSPEQVFSDLVSHSRWKQLFSLEKPSL